MGRKRKQESSEVEADQEESMASFEELRGKRIKKNTRNMYNAKIRVLKKWLANSQYKDSVVGNTMSLPLPVEAIKGFFGYLSRAAIERGKCKTTSDISTLAPTDPLSISSLQIYRSAIVDLYRSHGLDIVGFNGRCMKTLHADWITLK